MKSENRADIILKDIVQLYVRDGQPVGSTKLAQNSELSVSSATIRNVMSDLEARGLIVSPHTSAGRIPTAKGYRLFVDSYVKASPLNKNLISSLQEQFEEEYDPDVLIKKASKALSKLTEFAGVVMIPNQNAARFRQIEFMPLSSNRVLSILVTEDGRVQNRIINLSKDYSTVELTEAANYFNELYSGSDLMKVRKQLVDDIQTDNEEMHRITQNAMHIAKKALLDEDENETNKADVMVSGEQKLLDVPDLCQIDTLQKLFNVFKTKQDLLDLLDRSMKTDGVNIYIGEESGYGMLNDCSIVTKTYQSEGEVLGTLGVIGPTRMVYSDVVSVVDVTSTLLSNALSQK